MSLAFVFPGQGSQSIGMLSAFADKSIVRSTFKEASEALGYDLWELCQTGPVEALNSTEKTQPALLTASVALWRFWIAEGGAKPSLLAGHSLGEYSALVCAEVMTLATAVKLVEARGQFMQAAVPPGTGKMAAIIGLDDQLIQQACDESAQGQVVAPVNYNSPGQVVIAGELDAVDRAMEACKRKGAKRALPLPVSVPSHCALMKPAADQLADALAKLPLSQPKIPVINNVDVLSQTTSEGIKEALIRQLFNPVRWTETLQLMHKQGMATIVECGAGSVLTGLNKRIIKEINNTGFSNPEQMQTLIEQLSAE